jgi:hypothetical protein
MGRIKIFQLGMAIFMKKQKLVVGNGMAGMRTVEELLALAPEKYDITVIGREPQWQPITASCCRRCWPVKNHV